MNVSLTPELEQYIQGKVRGGLYQTASEVVREALRLLKEKEERSEQRLAELRAEIQKGIDQADRGEVSAFDESTLEEIAIRGREKLATRRKAKK